jgi:acetyl esterase/lipase
VNQAEFAERKVVLIGHSAGGLNAALLAMDEIYLANVGIDRHNTIAGLIGLAGGYDFLPLDEGLNGCFFPMETRNQSQAVNYAEGKHPPTLRLYGAQDRTVHPHNAVSLHQSLVEGGNDCVLKTYPNLGHIGTLSSLAKILRWHAPVLRDCLDFIEERVKSSV